VSSPSWVAGDQSDPFDNLMDAIEKAYEIASEYHEVTITIHLYKGDHFLTKEARDYFETTYIERNCQNLHLIIQPYYCPSSSPDLTICSYPGD